MNSLQNQVGGNHYKNMVFQPIELISALECSFIQGCIIKYISRYKNKKGAEDIKKCIHYAELAVKLNDKKDHKGKCIWLNIHNFVSKNKLSSLHRDIIMQAIQNNYNKVILLCCKLLSEEYPEEA